MTHQDPVLCLVALGLHPDRPPLEDLDVLPKYILDTLCNNRKTLVNNAHI